MNTYYVYVATYYYYVYSFLAQFLYICMYILPVNVTWFARRDLIGTQFQGTLHHHLIVTLIDSNSTYVYYVKQSTFTQAFFFSMFNVHDG